MRTSHLALALLALLINGCSSKEGVIPKSDTTMKEIYQRTDVGQGDNLRLVTARPATDAESDVTAYTLMQTPRADFRLLPNPTMYMYVQTHLTSDGSPIPAYVTEFRMFERDEYALPGEVALPIERK